MSSETKPLRVTQFDDPHGRGWITVETKQLLRTRVTGVATEGMVATYLREVLGLADIATHRVDVFHDWSELEGYEPGARTLFLKRSDERRRENRALFRGMHLLVHKTLILAALEVARVLYDKTIHTYRDRDAWMMALARVRREPSAEPFVRSQRG